MAKSLFVGAALVSLIAVSATAQVVPKDSAAKLASAPVFQIAPKDKDAGIGGEIKVAVDVDEHGAVARAIVYVGPAWPCDRSLDSRAVAVIRDAEEAVRSFKFTPAVKNGKPVSSRIGLVIAIDGARPAPKSGVPADQNPKPEKIEGGVINGKAKRLVKPPYPPEARAERAAGTVSVRVLIGEDGTVLSAQAIEGHALLQFAARAAACESKFTPTLLSGRPVKVSGVIFYNFIP